MSGKLPEFSWKDTERVAEAGAPVHEGDAETVLDAALPDPKARRIGVYVCHCGGNISDYVDVEAVVDAVKNEPGVVVAKTTIFACADASQSEMEADIVAENLDGLVVASCSPKLTS